MPKKKLGIILIVAGLFILFNSLNLLNDELFLYLLAATFIAVYFVLGSVRHYHNIGFLIPGVVLLAIALNNDLNRFEKIDQLGGGIFFILLGAAFLSLLLHTQKFKKWDWPLYPGLALSIFGLVFLFFENSSLFQELAYLNYLIPAILIIGGIILLYFSSDQK